MEEDDGLSKMLHENRATAEEMVEESKGEGYQSLMEALHAQYGGSIAPLRIDYKKRRTLEHFRIENLRYVPQPAEVGMIAARHFDVRGYNSKKISSGHYCFTNVDGASNHLIIETRNRSLTVLLCEGNPVNA